MTTATYFDGGDGGVVIGLSAAELVGFHGKTPTAQRSSANQAAVTTTVGAAVDTTGSSNSSPYGFTTSAQADAIVTNINALRADVLAMNTLMTEIRLALVNKGLIVGA